MKKHPDGQPGGTESVKSGNDDNSYRDQEMFDKGIYGATSI
jgi:hypothetical protein